jgi:hypothetical protein
MKGKGIALGFIFTALICSGCSSSTTISSNQGSVPWDYDFGYVSFPQAYTYGHALQIVTDMGLQPAYVCSISYTDYRNGVQAQWTPVGQEQSFELNRGLLIRATYLAPSNWKDQLQSMKGIRENGLLQIPQCVATISGKPKSSAPLILNSSQPILYSQIEFNSSTNYIQALSGISNLGLRLADVCYEAKWLNNQAPEWHQMGQEETFATSHSLLIATSPGVTSTLWKQQSALLPGVTRITSIYPVNCSG